MLQLCFFLFLFWDALCPCFIELSQFAILLPFRAIVLVCCVNQPFCFLSFSLLPCCSFSLFFCVLPGLVAVCPTLSFSVSSPCHALLFQLLLQMITTFTSVPISPFFWELYPSLMNLCFNDTGLDMTLELCRPVCNYIANGADTFLEKSSQSSQNSLLEMALRWVKMVGSPVLFRFHFSSLVHYMVVVRTFLLCFFSLLIHFFLGEDFWPSGCWSWSFLCPSNPGNASQLLSWKNRFCISSYFGFACLQTVDYERWDCSPWTVKWNCLRCLL